MAWKIAMFGASCALLASVILLGQSFKSTADRMADRICVYDKNYCPYMVQLGPLAYKYYPH